MLWCCDGRNPHKETNAYLATIVRRHRWQCTSQVMQQIELVFNFTPNPTIFQILKLQTTIRRMSPNAILCSTVIESGGGAQRIDFGLDESKIHVDADEKPIARKVRTYKKETCPDCSRVLSNKYVLQVSLVVRYSFFPSSISIVQLFAYCFQATSTFSLRHQSKAVRKWWPSNVPPFPQRIYKFHLFLQCVDGKQTNSREFA